MARNVPAAIRFKPHSQDGIKLPAHIDSELLLDFVSRDLVFFSNERIEPDTVLVIHLYPV